MTHEKATYWKKRMREKLLSHVKQRHIELTELVDNADHLNLNRKGIDKSIRKINDGYMELEKEIISAKIKRGKK